MAMINTLSAGPSGAPQDIEFKAESDQTAQKYVIILPDPFDKDKEHLLMIAMHGHGSDRWQYVKDMRGECKGARDIAAKYDMIFISPDYRAKTSWMGPKAEVDLKQIIAEVKTRYKISKVLLVGGSMGGTSALIFTALHPDLISGVSAQNATANLIDYPNFTDAIAASYGGTAQQIPDEYRRRSPEFFPERFNMPVAFTTGGRDTQVPPDSVLRLYEKIKSANPNVLLIHRPEGGHATGYEDTLAAIEFVVSHILK